MDGGVDQVGEHKQKLMTIWEDGSIKEARDRGDDAIRFRGAVSYWGKALGTARDWQRTCNNFFSRRAVGVQCEAVWL